VATALGNQTLVTNNTSVIQTTTTQKFKSQLLDLGSLFLRKISRSKKDC
jgi:hypothetical protein